MRRLFLAASLCAAAVPAAASWPSGVELEQHGVQGLGHLPGGGYHAAWTDVSAPFGKDGVYTLSARARIFQVLPIFGEWNQEYSVGLSRELAHVTVRGRLGTAAPNQKLDATVAGKKVEDIIRPSYHLAAGELLFSMYGLTLGPEHPEHSTTVWEKDEPAPSPDSYDRTWVTRWRMIYANTDVHIQQPSTLFVVVQNAWQFEARETWRDSTSLAFQMGFDRYNKVLSNQITTVYLDNVEYYGDPFAIRGWVNNFGSVQGWQELGHGARLTAGFSRLNLLNNQLVFAYSGGLEWRGEHWTAAPGFAYHVRRNTGVSRALTLELGYRW